MKTVLQAPGLYYEAVKPPAEPSPLRSDVAGFIGRTRRGPVGQAVRVTGWREYLLAFGGLAEDADTPYALQGYFENGGDVAYVVRLLGVSPAKNHDDLTATAIWDLTQPDRAVAAVGSAWDPRQGKFTSGAIRIRASSPGTWANGLRVKPLYRQKGTSGGPEIGLIVHAADEPIEQLIGLDPGQIVDQIAERSVLIRLELLPAPLGSPAQGDGPRLLHWADVVLGGALESSAPPTQDYLVGLDLLGDENEVALVAMPDLIGDLGAAAGLDVQQQAAARADALHDRLVLIDLPHEYLDSIAAAGQADKFRSADLADAARAAAAYHPWLAVQDPLGGTANPLRQIPPCGHVAGLISRYDRERGAHYTPANATLEGAIDVATSYALEERASLNGAGVSVVRCMPGRGVQVWGGRTLNCDDPWRFVAHRRLIHRLVRTIRQVAEPLVFDNNGPALWLALARAVTTILVEAYRAGGLKGDRPDQAFRVRCDATNNPPEETDLGRVLCEIDVAPAVPMEFITLRVALSDSGTLDVFEK
jgi:phage tail sheath protein FI